MEKRTNILLQTTIPFVEDDWHIGRFSMLHDHLASITDTTNHDQLEQVHDNVESFRRILNFAAIHSFSRFKR